MKKKESKISTVKKCAVLLASAMLLATGCGKGDEKTIDGSVQNIQPEELGSEASGSTSGTGQTGQAQAAPAAPRRPTAPPAERDTLFPTTEPSLR